MPLTVELSRAEARRIPVRHFPHIQTLVSASILVRPAGLTETVNAPIGLGVETPLYLPVMAALLVGS